MEILPTSFHAESHTEQLICHAEDPDPLSVPPQRSSI